MFKPCYRYSITLPVHDNDGVWVDAAHDQLRAALLNVAGGFTVQDSQGAWRDGDAEYSDSSRIYTVTTDTDCDGDIMDAALNAALAATQECVYVERVCPAGGVSRAFVTPAPDVLQAAREFNARR